MLEQFLNHIEQNNLCTPDQQILLAVSGGLDSMVMLNLFVEAGYSVSVAHCNFQLRGADSDKDEALLRESCTSLRIPFYVKHFETSAYAKQKGVSIQMAARELRYAWFDELLDKHNLHYLATAHHLNDTIETILLKWIHGASSESFSGIPVANKRTIRPMLFAMRDEIEMFAKEKQIVWREDSSNETNDYQRNFLRHQVIPKLKEINPSLEATIQRGLKKVKDEQAFLWNQIDQWKTTCFKRDEWSITIDKKSFINVTILWLAIKEYGFNYDQCEEIGEALHKQSGKQFKGKGYQLTIDRDHLILAADEKFSEAAFIEAGQTTATLGFLNLEIIQSDELSPVNDRMIATLDADKLTFPLRWCKWKAGDFFYPLGMVHKRKLSDFLIDRKVSVAEKGVVTVLESDGKIAWVVGHQIDERFKITPQTKSAISFSLSPHFR